MLQYALIKRDTFHQAAYTGCPAHRCRVSIADVKTLFLTPCLPRRFDRCWNSSINVHHHWGYSSSSRPRLTRQNNAQHVLRPFSLPSPAVMPHPLTSAKCLNETPNVTQKNSCRPQTHGVGLCVLLAAGSEERYKLARTRKKTTNGSSDIETSRITQPFTELS